MARRKAFVNLFDLFDFDVLKSVMGQFLLADVGQPQLALKRPPGVLKLGSNFFLA